MGPERVALLCAAAAALVVLAVGRADRPVVVWATTSWRLCLTVVVFARYAWLGVLRRAPGPELVRRAFEDLGPTYLKLAQMIASSAGLFPEAYSREFKKTLDRVRPFSFVEVERILEEDLQAPIYSRFSFVDPEPLASASIAQVHAATTLEGREVVLKIQRPGIERRVVADMRIMRVGAWFLSLAPRLELANPIGIVDDFARTLGEELDFQLEARNMDEFNAMMHALGHHDVRAPLVDHALTSRRVIAMERFRGVRVDDVEAIGKRDVDPEAKLVHGLRCWFQSLILYGFFHGDVHAGNLMLLDDGALGFLDFGIIGRFSRETRQLITDYIIAFATGQYRDLARVMLRMDAIAHGVDLELLARDLERAYAPMLKLSFGEIKYGDLLPEIMRVSVKHRVRLPREFVLVTKQMLYFDRYAKLLAPRLNIFSDPRLVSGITEDVMRARIS